MSILDAYETHPEPIVTPDQVIPRLENVADTAVVCFSYKAKQHVLATYEHVLYNDFHATCNGTIEIYFLPQIRVLFFMSPIGAAIAGAMLQEISYLAGIKRFIYFGSCGTLDESAKGKIIVPTACYREEGYSYHYAAPSDYIEIKNHKTVAAFFEKRGVPFVLGKGWTTDAIYNETKAKYAARRKEGVIAADMEASGLQAIANHLNVELYIFFFSADILGEVWQRNDLGGDNEKTRQISAADLALELGKELQH